MIYLPSLYKERKIKNIIKKSKSVYDKIGPGYDISKKQKFLRTFFYEIY